MRVHGMHRLVWPRRVPSSVPPRALSPLSSPPFRRVVQPPNAECSHGSNDVLRRANVWYTCPPRAVAFICANAGDSRAVLCRKPAPPVAPPSNDGDATTDAAPGNTSLSAGVATAGAAAPTAAKDWGGTARSSAIRLTTDHKPTLTSERDRIVAAGGMVLTVGGVPRVCSENSPCMLAVSRALGDRSLKFGGSVPRGLITEVPDCTYHPYDGSELLVVLMSDGVSDVLEDQAISDVALEAALAAGAATPEEAADAAAEAVVRRARDLHSPDDITAVVVILSEDAWKGGLIEAPTPPLNLDYEEVDTA